MSEWYRVNVDEEDIEVIHHEPPTPKCDIKHIMEDVVIDTESVERLIKQGAARWCRHCFPER